MEQVSRGIRSVFGKEVPHTYATSKICLLLKKILLYKKGGEKMGLFRILKDVVVITATVAAVSTVAAPLWMLVNDMDDD